ncbi:MAG: lysozyme inhibitor LprI family protein [Candidatus Angelobacter sp.]
MKRYWLAVVVFALALPAFSQTTSVVTELSSRTGMSVKDLNNLLLHCESTQLSMDICAQRDLVAADMEMQRVLQKTSLRLNQTHKRALAKVQVDWLSQAKAKCNMVVNLEVGEGSMGPLIYGKCMTAATQERTRQLRKRQDGS